MKRLADKTGVDLPKGAAPQVDEAGRKLVEIYGPDILSKVAKVHFKNYRRALAGKRLL
jgi:ribonuclease HIII